MILSYRYLGSSPSDEDLELTVRSATFQSLEKYLIKIECTDLENEAKTICKVTNLSFNFVLQLAQAVNRQPGFRLKDA